MRYLFLLLTLTVACGDQSAKPKRQKDDQGMMSDQDMMLDEGLGFEDASVDHIPHTNCTPLDCSESELIDMIQVKREFEYALLGGFEFEPEPFEFRRDMY